MDNVQYDAMGNVVGFETVAGEEPNFTQVDFYRNKVRQFQDTLLSLEPAYYDLQAAGQIAALDPEAYEQWLALVQEFENKRSQFGTVGQAINLASQGINAVGVQFPSVQLPGGLAAAPLVPLAAAAAAVGAAVLLINWTVEFFKAVREFAARWQHLDAIKALPEGERAAALATLQKTEASAAAAVAAASASPLTSIATITKWVAIAGGAFLIYKLMNEGLKHGNR